MLFKLTFNRSEQTILSAQRVLQREIPELKILLVVALMVG